LENVFQNIYSRAKMKTREVEKIHGVGEEKFYSNATFGGLFFLELYYLHLASNSFINED
jgi:hypothetical protein